MIVPEKRPGPSPIAIVGIGLRLPGGCHDAQSYWDLLVHQKDARKPIPPERFNIDGFHKESDGVGSLSMRHGYFLDEPADRFDAGFFSMSQTEVARVDPQQRLLLEVMHEALENAGEVGWRGSNIAVYAGSFGQDWLQMQARDPQDGNVYGITGMDDFVLANRVSYEFDLHGPSMTVKAGCSSSLIALDLACEALQRGDCSGALVGASNLLLSPEYFLALENLGALSSAGSSNTFDTNASGYARADAVNAVYVKRLDDALRDGNPIRAIVRSTAVNSDGKTVGLTNPSTDAQARLIRRAYEKAGIINPGETPVVECHGTGTATGDPQEVAAVVQVFGGQETYIGSVKPNIGHGEGAAGLSSLIKAVLSLERNTIPPNIKFTTPNPKIPFTEARLVVPTKATPWPKGRSRRISVDSFGLGGANAHVILEGYPTTPSPHRNGIPKVNGHTKTSTLQRLLVFSAHNETSIAKMTSNYQAFTESESYRIKDLAYTLGARRSHHKWRSFCITDGKSFQPTPAVRSSDPKGLLFIFTGQGAQWSGMGRELIRDFKSFREDIRQMDQWLSKTLYPPSWKMEDVLLNSQEISSAEYAQPLCTAIQIGLTNLLREWKITPDGVVGHSSGEIAAAYAVGALEMRDAILVAFYRGVASSQQKRPGAMAAVGLGRHEVSNLLSAGTTIACENSRSSVTISGDYDAVEETLDRVRQYWPDALARKLKVDRAYHSDHMRSVGIFYEELISTIKTSTNSLIIPFFSSVTGQATYDASLLGPTYWRANMERPVLFLSAVENALESMQEFGLALELGPHSALSGPFRQVCKESDKRIIYNSCLSRGADATTTILTAIGQLYCQGLTPDFSALSPGGVTMSNLPPYPWTHDASYWNESRISHEFRTRPHPEHELLGARVIGGNDMEPSWRKLLNLKEVAWLSDHVVAEDVVFPAAGYVAMAGEAIKQITGTAGFAISSLSIGSAMPLNNARATEIITRLQPHRLTDDQDSTWFDFSVMSYDGNTWTRHCNGKVHPGNASTLSMEETKSSPAEDGAREVISAKWYQAAKAAGLEYGPAFQGLQDASYNATRDCISSTLQTPLQTSSVLHPTTMDQLLQCCILGSVKGHLRLMGKLVLPVHIDEMYIADNHSFEGLYCETHSDFTGADMMEARGHIRVGNGSLALQAKGIRFRILENNRSKENALQELRLLEWRPSIDLVDLRQLVQQTTDLSGCLELVEKLNIFCVLETTRILKSMENTQQHFKRFKEWNEEYVNNIRLNGSNVVQDTDHIFEMTSAECEFAIKELTAEALETPARDIALAITRIFYDVENIFTGAAEPLAVLLRDDLLMKIYNFFNMLDHRHFFRLLGHNKKTLRIIEIGAGTGGFTSTIVPALTDSAGGCLFSTYTYTDISSGFFKAAKERFSEYPGIEYTVLDISEDPASQGLELNSYDLVVAANVLHATPDLLQTMKNCRSLLRPGGRVFLLELCSEAKWVNYIMGTLSGWWLGEPDGRLNEPYIQAQQWDDILQEAGFENVTAIMDQAPPFQLDNIVIANAVDDALAPPKALSLLVPDTTQVAGPAAELVSKFQSEGYEVSLCSLWDLPTAPLDIVSLLDIMEPQTFFQGLTDRDLRGLIRFITHTHGQKLLWLTGPAQISTKDPHSAMVLGFARTLRLELGTIFATMELDITTESSPWNAVVDVFAKLQKQGKNDLVDCEYALVDGTVQVPRYITRSSDAVLPMASEQISRQLHVAKPGLLSSLQWQGSSREVELKEGELEIAVRASSVNYQDTLLALGHVHSNHGLGLDCAGVITRVNSGADKDNLQVGDRVLCWSAGSLATHVRADSQRCIKIPDTLDFNEAVTIPTTYGTMIRGLIDIGSLTTMDSVLIHSAADAMGIAAIQIARMQGAEIFATAATEEEKHFLTTEHGIPMSRIFSSQDNSFVAAIMQNTQSRGVDIVVNSLSGELLHESWKCVAEGGNMIDISGKDVAGHGKLDMALFNGNRGFHGLDMASLVSKKPSLTRRLLEASIKLYTDGLVKPIRPIHRFSTSDVKHAFHQFQGHRPIGAICIEFPDDPLSFPIDSFDDKTRFREDRSYVLIGGLGGLGRSAAVWLAERGAGSIIFMSRSASPSVESTSLVRELKALGCEVQIFTGSVTDASAVENLVANAAKPIAGMLHLALVLKDEAVLDMTFDSWQGATEAKVQGTWNLHNALKDQPLDFFILLSSIYGVQGNPKQANYAAASTFLDAFVQFRQQLGLPASVIDLGVMEDIGFVSQHPTILENLRRAGAQLIRENDFIGALQLAVRASSQPAPAPPTLASGYVNRAQFVVGLGQHPPDARGLGLKVDGTIQGQNNTQAVVKEDGDALKQFMENATRDPSSLEDETAVAEFLAAQVAECLKTLLIFSDSSDLNLKLGLAELGVDSLIAIELQTWWIQNFATNVTILELTKSASVMDLGKLARSRILEELHGRDG